jgi:hypothetical protein
MIDHMTRVIVKGEIARDERQEASCPFACINQAWDGVETNALAEAGLAVFTQPRL